MQQIVSITSQGQMTIPVAMRLALGLDRYNKAMIRREDQRLVVEPVEDILAFYGSLADKAIPGKTGNEVVAIEEQAWEKEAAKKYRRGLKQ